MLFLSATVLIKNDGTAVACGRFFIARCSTSSRNSVCHKLSFRLSPEYSEWNYMGFTQSVLFVKACLIRLRALFPHNLRCRKAI